MIDEDGELDLVDLICPLENDFEFIEAVRQLRDDHWLSALTT